jgi:hypothetical protein
LAVADVITVVVALVIAPSDPTMAPAFVIAVGLAYAVGISSFAGMGALLVARVPQNVIGRLLLAAGTILVLGVVLQTYAAIGALQDPPWPGVEMALRLGDSSFIYPIVISLVLIPLYFPDGRLLSSRYRWVVRITAINLVVWFVEALRDVRDTGTTPTVPGLEVLDGILGVLEIYVLVAMLVGFAGGAIAVATRFRRGGPVQRQQVKWLLAVVALGAIAWPAYFLSSATEIGNVLVVLGFLALFALPIVIAVAILRYRLYEIDGIVSRTIAYGAVTVVLGATFVGIILAVQGLLAPYTKDQTIAVAFSTLVVFALFQPLRRRIQTAVDRRFNRARYDAERTAAAFAARLGSRTDMTTVTTDLALTTVSTVAPSSLSIWLRGSSR